MYTVTDGLVSEANTYYFTQAYNILFFHHKPLLPGQQVKDSLRTDFKDKANTVVVNNTDRYILFSAYYARFKKDVNAKHSVIALLNLLCDTIGDYHVWDALTLINNTPLVDKRIQQAIVTTQRFIFVGFFVFK